MIAPTHAFAMNSRFVVRTPMLPQRTFMGWCDLGDGDDSGDLEAIVGMARERLNALLGDATVREAMYIASPSLVEAVPQWREDPDSERGAKTERALVRYLSRMSTRATPFGLFSGVSVGHVAPATALQLAPRRDYSRATRLDSHFVDELCEALVREPSIASALPLVPNSSIYTTASRLRYVASSTASGRRTHALVDVDAHDAVHVVLTAARGGATAATLVEALLAADPDTTPEEATSFIRELYDHRILCAEFAPPVTADAPLRVLTQRMGGHPPLLATRDVLSAAVEELRTLDRDGVGADTARYERIAITLAALPVSIVPGRLFQVDLFKPATLTLAPKVRRAVEDGIATLHRISASPPSWGLEQFREAFRARFGAREVALTVALDADLGVGFEPSEDPAASAEPLLAGLSFPSPRPAVASWSSRHDYLARRLEALPRGERRLELDDSDLAALTPLEPPAPLPDAFAALAVLEATSEAAVDRGEFTVHLQGIAGPSGARLLGRFCHLDPELRATVDEHIAAEQALRPEAVFAEVVHVSEGRVANVVARPVLREYEIEFLGESGAPQERRIALDDLSVCVHGDRIVLRSRRLGREVVPRLSSAHAYSGPNLPIYRFLCALQDQGVARAGWSWGPLDALQFLPRVCWGNLAFSRARWRLSRPDFAALVHAAQQVRGSRQAAVARRTAVMRAADALRERAALPRWVELADGDHHLAVDFDNPLSVDSFAHLLHGRASVTVRELVPAPEQLAVSGPEGSYAHELCIPFTRTAAPATRPEPMRRPHGVVNRAFVPGGEWLYAKVYTGQTHADRVLQSVVAPITAALREQAGVDRWFFLRFADPQPHLRVRWHGDGDALLRCGMPLLRSLVSEWIDEDAVSRVQIETYEPEYDRYGGPGGLDVSERVFAADSDAALDILAQLEGDGGLAQRWQSAVCSIDMLLDDLDFDLERRLTLVRAARDAFDREFRVDTAFRRQLAALHRSRHARIEALLCGVDDDDTMAGTFAALRRRRVASRAAVTTLRRLDEVGALSAPLDDIARAWIHMTCNRLLRSAHRAQEVVLYDLLSRAYDSLRARGKAPPVSNHGLGGAA